MGFLRGTPFFVVNHLKKKGGITKAVITTASIIITGIFGNIAADALWKLFHITEPIAKGISIGTAAHAFGTAKALETGETEGAMSSLSIVVSGLCTVVLANIFAGFM